MGRNREALGGLVEIRKNMTNILPEILKEYIFLKKEKIIKMFTLFSNLHCIVIK